MACFKTDCRLVSKLLKCRKVAVAGLEIDLCGVGHLCTGCFLKSKRPFYFQTSAYRQPKKMDFTVLHRNAILAKARPASPSLTSRFMPICTLLFKIFINLKHKACSLQDGKKKTNVLSLITKDALESSLQM